MLLTFACVDISIVVNHIIQKAARAISLVYPPTKIFVILSWHFFSAHALWQLQVTSSNFIIFIQIIFWASSFRPLRSISFFFFFSSFHFVLYWIERALERQSNNDRVTVHSDEMLSRIDHKYKPLLFVLKKKHREDELKDRENDDSIYNAIYSIRLDKKSFWTNSFTHEHVQIYRPNPLDLDCLLSVGSLLHS